MRNLAWTLFSIFLLVPVIGIAGAVNASDTPIEAAAGGAVQPLTVNPVIWIEQKIIANDGAAGGGFGYSVAVSGTTAVVGAVFATVNGNFKQGAAYVFTQSDGRWTLVQKLTADDGATKDEFGTSVAVSGNTILIGADEVNINGNKDQGAAYVFTHSGDHWNQAKKLIARTGSKGDHFGYSVALKMVRLSSVRPTPPSTVMTPKVQFMYLPDREKTGIRSKS